MRTSRLFWKLFLVSVGLNLMLAIAFLLIVMASQRSEINRQVEQRLWDTALVLRSHVAELIGEVLDPDADPGARASSLEQLQNLLSRLALETDNRLTIVDSAGTVLADSDHDPSTMANHANRPELIAAREIGKGTATRSSPTLHVNMFYLALAIEVPSAHPAFVRVAVRLDTINERVAAVVRWLSVLALIFGGIATGLTYAIVGRIITPLAEVTSRAQAIASGIDEAPLYVRSHDEIGLLAAAFNQMQSEMARRFDQLRENNEQLSTVLGSMHDGVIAVDADERIVLANDAGRLLIGLDSASKFGRPLREAVRSPLLLDLVQKCLKTGDSAQIEFEADGEIRRKHLAVRATCLPGAPAHGVVMVLHDITELRRLENLRREFVANVSHELKTPLASITAYAETLRLGAMDDRENNIRFLGQIEDQAERLHQLILDMLQIARVESGEEAFDITQVWVRRRVEASCTRLSEPAQRKQINLSVEGPSEDLSIVADEDGFDTILDNLIGNAIKYTPAGGRVDVRWRDENGYVELEVQDTGGGIAPIHHARVFERFYRVDKARSRELGGTGLGLSIVKHLCQAFGGTVTLSSGEGEGEGAGEGAGCTFCVRLPRADAENQSA